jgi:hypothetical protein
MEFKVGDRVKSIIYTTRSPGIIMCKEGDTLGVEHDDYMMGHHCSYTCKSGHGYWYTPSELELISPSQDILILLL